MVENVFEILKKTFTELLGTSQLHVSLLPDVVSCCCILHNLILDSRDVDIDKLIEVLAVEEQCRRQGVAHPLRPLDVKDADGEEEDSTDRMLQGDACSGSNNRVIVEWWLGERRHY